LISGNPWVITAQAANGTGVVIFGDEIIRVVKQMWALGDCNVVQEIDAFLFSTSKNDFPDALLYMGTPGKKYRLR